ncbi:MAG: glycosyltransferase family 4 protein [Treponema sp.]|nr:glycosyltransferase family 4 protein [Treponema sp.]
MTIAIDCRMVNASGIGVYLRGALPWFFNTDNNFFLIGNFNDLQQYKSLKNITIITCNVKPFSINELVFFPKEILKQINKADIFYSPFFNIPCGIKIPVYTTIHDIIFADIPGLSSRIGFAVRMRFFKRAYIKSKKIFTVSEFSKSRINHHLGNEKEIIVTYSAIQQMFLDYKSSLINKKETIVFIGNIKKHKGLDCLLDAYKAARDEGLTYKLVIIGSNNNFRSSDKAILKKIESIGNIIFTGFISDNELMEHLCSASLLVQPSLYEGFCLPPLEAMTLGTQVLISDIPVLKEVYEGFPVTFFKTNNSNDLKEKLLELLYKKTIITLSIQEHLLSKYTFKKTASVILDNLQPAF